MKIKSFFAPNLVNALNIIETLYKKEAVIHSVTGVNQGVKVSVFLKQQKKEFESQAEKFSEKKKYFMTQLKHLAFDDILIERLTRATKNKSLKPNDDKLLSLALGELFQFNPIYPITSKKVYVFIGNTGVGKTTALQKMAYLAKNEHFTPAILSLKKNNDLLETFSKENHIAFYSMTEDKTLNETVTLLRLQSNYILIDTPPLNPFHKEDMHQLKTIKNEISDAEFILVMPAGLDEKEAIAQGAIFHKNGCDLLLASNMDTHVMYSSLCKTLLHNPLQLTGFSLSSKIADPIIEATPQNLAKLFSPQKN